MPIHLSKFEFVSKGKQMVVVQNKENKKSTPIMRKNLFSHSLAMLAQIPILFFPSIPRQI